MQVVRSFGFMEELDIVELLAAVAGVDVSHAWPAGTRGVILELWDDRALIEVANDGGQTLDMPFVPRDQLKVVWVNATRTWLDADHRAVEPSAEIRVSSRTRARGL